MQQALECPKITLKCVRALIAGDTRCDVRATSQLEALLPSTGGRDARIQERFGAIRVKIGHSRLDPGAEKRPTLRRDVSDRPSHEQTTIRGAQRRVSRPPGASLRNGIDQAEACLC